MNDDNRLWRGFPVLKRVDISLRSPGEITPNGADFAGQISIQGVKRRSHLGGKEIYADPLTVQYQALQQINDKLQKAGKPLIVIKPADKYLLGNDLVQMVIAGLLPATITTSSRTKLWSEVLHQLTIHPPPVIAEGEQTGWAVRKNNPQLKQLLYEFIAPRAAGSPFGNTPCAATWKTPGGW